MSVSDIIQRLKLFVNLINKKSNGSLSFNPFHQEQQMTAHMSFDSIEELKSKLFKATGWMIEKAVDS
jgi:hypothetical protein